MPTVRALSSGRGAGGQPRRERMEMGLGRGKGGAQARLWPRRGESWSWSRTGHRRLLGDSRGGCNLHPLQIQPLPPKNKTGSQPSPALPGQQQVRAGGASSGRGDAGPAGRMLGKGLGDAEPGRAVRPPQSRYLQRPARGGPAARPSRSSAPPGPGLGRRGRRPGVSSPVPGGEKGGMDEPSPPPPALSPLCSGGGLLRPGGASPRGSAGFL